MYNWDQNLCNHNHSEFLLLNRRKGEEELHILKVEWKITGMLAFYWEIFPKKKSGLAECILQYKVETGQKWTTELGQIEGGGIIAVRATKLRPPCNLAQHVLLK